MAKETAKLAAAQIQQSGASAMLAQANQMDKEMVATLLKAIYQLKISCQICHSTRKLKT
jgi:aspartyl/asparaginyl-tRNA synthetase